VPYLDALRQLSVPAGNQTTATSIIAADIAMFGSGWNQFQFGRRGEEPKERRFLAVLRTGDDRLMDISRYPIACSSPDGRG
jgi:hypothetical protein